MPKGTVDNCRSLDKGEVGKVPSAMNVSISNSILSAHLSLLMENPLGVTHNFASRGSEHSASRDQCDLVTPCNY